MPEFSLVIGIIPLLWMILAPYATTGLEFSHFST